MVFIESGVAARSPLSVVLGFVRSSAYFSLALPRRLTALGQVARIVRL